MHCAALPYLGQTAGGRWVDTGSEMPGFDNHVYLHESSVYEAARLLGYPDRGEYIAVKQRADEAEARVAEVEAELEAKTEVVDAIYALRNNGFAPTVKPGRPPREKAA